ncbi:hypothetical protein GA0070608_0090 [Micromonospora peucetia]|uniref:Uncharacterized protein n=1 Tax=Micromonospora peucetia TaxID=47871 RepID=A0A1C6TVT2_9ACTN|nr:hypothetical protein GA0070608_0090 [Micromonospora peucetia]
MAGAQSVCQGEAAGQVHEAVAAVEALPVVDGDVHGQARRDGQPVTIIWLTRGWSAASVSLT